jgi:hypothetical protein
LEEFDSDCSSDLKRRSPQTQVQSLSDGNSSSSLKITAQSYSLESDLDLSSEDEFDHKMGKFENKERKFTTAFSDFEGNMYSNNYPRFAANPDSIYPKFVDIDREEETKISSSY